MYGLLQALNLIDVNDPVYFDADSLTQLTFLLITFSWTIVFYPEFEMSWMNEITSMEKDLKLDMKLYFEIMPLFNYTN